MKEVKIQNTTFADAIIENLRFRLILNLDWLQFAFPNVKKAKNEAGKFLPAAYNQDGTLQFVTPSSKTKSFCFFEKKNYKISEKEDYNTYDLSLFFWVQLDKIRTELTDFTDELIYQVSEVLISNRAADISVDLSNPFQGFDIEELKTIYPYSTFKVNFKVFGFKNFTNSGRNTFISNALNRPYLQKQTFEAAEGQTEFLCSFLLNDNCLILVNGTELESAFYEIKNNLINLLNPMYQYDKITIIN